MQTRQAHVDQKNSKKCDVDLRFDMFGTCLLKENKILCVLL